jgi:hypothetical protein
MRRKGDIFFFPVIFLIILAFTNGCKKRYTNQVSPTLTKSSPEPSVESPTPIPSPEIDQKNKVMEMNMPSEVEASMPFTVTIKVKNSGGSIDEKYNEKVSILIGSYPKDGSSFFQTTNNLGTFNNGEITFDQLSIEKPGEGYTLKVLSMFLTAQSKPFNVLPVQPKELTVIFNGKRKKVKLKPPNIIVDEDGDEFPVYNPGKSEFTVFGKHFKVKFVSPTELIVDEKPAPVRNP